MTSVLIGLGILSVFTALITRPIAKIAVIVAIVPLLLLNGAGSFETLVKGRESLGRQPPLMQAAQM